MAALLCLSLPWVSPRLLQRVSEVTVSKASSSDGVSVRKHPESGLWDESKAVSRDSPAQGKQKWISAANERQLDGNVFFYDEIIGENVILLLLKCMLYNVL